MKKLMDSLGLREVGLLELLLASTQLLAGYTLFGLPMMLVIWLVMIAVVVFKGHFKIRLFLPLFVYAIYWSIHETFILCIDNNTNVNALIGQVVYFIGFMCIYSHLDEKKLKGCFNWVAIIAIIGLVIQWLQILRGELVHPIELPGFAMPDNRLEQEIPRPSSFFMEPQAFVSFMVIPLFFSLKDKMYVWMSVIILSIFLTTSTTGILGVFIMLFASLFVNKKRSWSSVIIIILGGVFAFALFNSSIFELGVDKLLETDSGTNEHRLEQGMYIVSTMNPLEMVFGVPFSSAYHYCLSGRAPNVAIYGSGADAVVYMSSFWYLILRFGIVGLVLYLNVYLSVFRKNKEVLPLLFFMIAVLFSNPDGTGVNYIVCLLVMLCVAESSYKVSNVHQ